MNQSQAWLLATRPKTLFASLGPVILGLGYAYFENTQLKIIIAILTGLCALLMQIGTNLVNDYFDSIKGVDNEKRLGPTRVTAQGLLSPTEVKMGFRLSLGLALLLGIILMIEGGIPIIIIGISSLIFAYIYTGGPYPLSYHGLGELSAFIFFGPVAVWGAQYLQTGEINPLSILLGAGPGFIAATIMGINNLRDINSDRDALKRTLAVRMGEAGVRNLCLSFVLLSSFIPIAVYFYIQNPLVLTVTFLPYLFFKNWLFIYKGPINSELNQVLATTGKYLFLYCLLLSLTLNLS